MNSTTNISAETLAAVDTGDIAWTLTSSILMMLMTPGVGLLYAGLVRQKNVLTIFVQSVAIFSVASVVWALLGFSLAFGSDSGRFIGDSSFFGFRDLRISPFSQAPTIPGLLFFFYQLCACAVTPAIVVGSVAERLALGPSLAFVAVWVIVVYSPVAHWVWGYGWLYRLGAIDYAGGMVVHMCAGYSSLALLLVTGRRVGATKEIHPQNNTYVVLGTVLLWFGWFGFNGGSAYAANYQSVLAVVATNISACMASISWVCVEYLFTRKFGMMGFIYGAGAGLIAMTAGSGYCPVWSSLVIGCIGGALSSLHSQLRSRYEWFDDATDVFSAHGISGTWGVFATGLWPRSVENGVSGAFFGHDTLLGYQVAGILAVGGYCFVVTFLLGLIMKATHILRVSEKDEEAGLDAVYGEPAYIILPQADPVAAPRVVIHHAIGSATTERELKPSPTHGDPQFDVHTQGELTPATLVRSRTSQQKF